MSYRVRYTKGARDDLKRLHAFLLERDPHAAALARAAIGKSIGVLQEFPFHLPQGRPERPLSPGTGHFVRRIRLRGLFEIEDNAIVTILAIRHQREDDYL